MTDQPIMPFEFRWCYETINPGEQELCNVLQIAKPANVAPLHIDISNILDDASLTIKPIEIEGDPDEGHYHFKLQFGKEVDAQQVAVEGDNWLIGSFSSPVEEIIYLLWQGEEMSLSPADTKSIEIILTGVSTLFEQPAEEKDNPQVTIYWDIESTNDWEIVPDKADDAQRPSTYFTDTTLELKMVKATGISNIPLYVGFVNGNKVLNTHEQANSLQLRITNTNLPGMTDPDSITFKYDSELNVSSILEVILEAEDNDNPGTLPWALGTEDQVNNISISITVAGQTGLWNDNGKEQIIVDEQTKAWKWSFIPASADIVLKPQETILIDLTNIITAHPTGETNLYLGYKNVGQYADGQFVCQIEKAPLVFDNKVWMGSNEQLGDTPESLLNVHDGTSLDKLNVTNDLSFGMHLGQHINLWGTSFGIGIQPNTTYFRTSKNFAWYQRGTHDDDALNPGDSGTVQMAINEEGNLGIGTAQPAAKLDVFGKTKSQDLDVSSHIDAGSLNVKGTTQSLDLDVGGSLNVGISAQPANINIWSGEGNIKINDKYPMVIEHYQYPRDGDVDDQLYNTGYSAESWIPIISGFSMVGANDIAEFSLLFLKNDQNEWTLYAGLWDTSGLRIPISMKVLVLFIRRELVLDNVDSSDWTLSGFAKSESAGGFNVQRRSDPH